MITYTIKNNDCSLQVYESGNQDSNTCILFLHGGPGSGAKPLMELSAFKQLEAHYHCIYFDQRGSGLSTYDIGDGLSIEMITNDVYAVTLEIKKRYHIKNLILWGGSFGGCLALLCMESFPNLYDKCILSSPAITFNRQQALQFFWRMQASFQNRMKDSTPVNHEQEEPETVFSNPNFREFIFSIANPSNSLKHICAMSSWFYNHSFKECLENLNRPTLILQGKEDLICTYQNIDDVVKQIDNSCINYVLYEDCGHAVFEDKENEFVEQIMNYIGGK